MSKVKEEESCSLASVRTLSPLGKTESHLIWRDKRVTLRGIFGLPAGVVVERVKIGHFSFEEMGSFGKSVFPGQHLVVVLENTTNIPQSLVQASLAIEVADAVVAPDRAERKEEPEPRARPGATLLPFTLLFGGGRARVGFIVRELSTLEEIWMHATCVLSEMSIMGTVFTGPSLYEWRGRVVSPGTPIEVVFSTRGASTRARAVVRLQKLEFPNAFGGER